MFYDDNMGIREIAAAAYKAGRESAQQSVQRTAKKRGKKSAEGKGEWVRLADSVFPNRRR